MNWNICSTLWFEDSIAIADHRVAIMLNIIQEIIGRSSLKDTIVRRNVFIFQLSRVSLRTGTQWSHPQRHPCRWNLWHYQFLFYFLAYPAASDGIFLSLLYRLIIQNFWSGQSLMSDNSTLSRLAGVLKLHSPDIEHLFLSYSTNLILELTSKSVDFNRHIFDHPLSECKYEVRQIYDSCSRAALSSCEIVP